MEPEPESSSEKSEDLEYIVEAQAVEPTVPVAKAERFLSYLSVPLRGVPFAAWVVLSIGLALVLLVAILHGHLWCHRWTLV